jgi:F0F1-type ATP synthase assembly protein I
MARKLTDLPEKTVVMVPVLLVAAMLFWLPLSGLTGRLLLACLATTVAMLCLAYCRAHDAASRLQRRNLRLQVDDPADPWVRSNLL